MTKQQKYFTKSDIKPSLTSVMQYNNKTCYSTMKSKDAEYNKHTVRQWTYATFQHHQLEKYNKFMLELL